MQTKDRFFFWGALLALTVFGIMGRMYFHLPDTTPLTALLLIAGAYLGRRSAVVLPLVVLAVSDIFLGWYDWRLMAVVYGSFMLIGLASAYASPKRPVRTLSLALGSSIFFFLTTNFAVWAMTPWYAKTFGGLMESYLLGLPFLRNMLIGDAFYTISLFMVCELAIASYRSFALRPKFA